MDASLRLFTFVFLIGLSASPNHVRAFDFKARALADKVARANEEFRHGNVDQAFRAYTDGLLIKPDSTELQFNLGDVHYRKGAYDEAVKAFEGILDKGSPKMRAKVHYNLGNTYFRLGAKKGDMQMLKKAIESYKEALKLDPDDVDAKYNIEYIRRKLKENSKRRQKQQDKQQQQRRRDKKQQDKQKQQQKKDKQQQRRRDKKQQDKQKQQQKKDKQQRRRQDKQQQKQKQGAKKKIDKEQAKRLLDRMSEDEKRDMREQMRRRGGRQRGVVNDW